MPELKKVAEKSALLSEPVIGVNVEGWRIALVRLGDEYYALEDDCPHERCHISDGLLEGDGANLPLPRKCHRREDWPGRDRPCNRRQPCGHLPAAGRRRRYQPRLVIG